MLRIYVSGYFFFKPSSVYKKIDCIQYDEIGEPQTRRARFYVPKLAPIFLRQVQVDPTLPSIG